MKAIYILPAFVITTMLNAQVLKLPFNTTYKGLGAYSRNFADVFSGTANHASLANLEKAGFAVYGEQRFLLKELSAFTAIVAVPLKTGVIGIQGNFFGSSLNNENQLGAFYSRRISKQVNIGVKFNSYSSRIAGYGSAQAINVETGIIYHINDQLHTGFHIYNPIGGKLNKNNNEKLPFIYKYGLGYELSQLVLITGEVEKQESQKVNINVGLQYNLHEKVFIRTGIATLYNTSYVALGIQLGFARTDITASYHPQLGLTPGFLFLMNLAKDNKD